MRRAGLVLLALGAIAPALPATSASAAPARTTLNDVEDELMCDTCNVPLNIAESPRANQERRELRRLIAQGMTKQQILDRFAAEYGPDVLASPRKGGIAVAAWAVPAVVVLALVVALAFALPRWRRRRDAEAFAASADAEPPELSPADAHRLERDLARYEP